MRNVLKVTVLTAVIGTAVLSLTAPAHGVGAVLGSVFAPPVVYVAPPPPVYYYPPPPPVYYGTVVYAPRYRRGYYRNRHR
jgi:hypothetical protein